VDGVKVKRYARAQYRLGYGGIWTRQIAGRNLEMSLDERDLVGELAESESGGELDAQRLTGGILGHVVHVHKDERPFGGV
jgi:hypothetical protein